MAGRDRAGGGASRAGGGASTDGGGPEVDVDLDAPTSSPVRRTRPPRRGGDRGRSPRRRRLVAAGAAGAVALVALLAVQHARGGQRGTEDAAAGLVGAGGGLVQASRPTSADNNTRAVLTVDLRNDTAAPVTLLALRPADDAGSLLRDDLRSSGAESMGVEQGRTLRPGRRVAVVMAGVVRCPGAGGGPAVTGDLSASVRDLDGVAREVTVPGPTDRSWTTALERACAAGPAR